MATLRKRGGSWQAQIRRQGHVPVSRSFPTRDEAVRWARMAEHAMDADKGSEQAKVLAATQADDSPTIDELLGRYEREITPSKKGADREIHKLRVIRRHPVSQIKVSTLKRSDLSTYRNDRLALVKPATAKRELAIIRHCLEIAIREWDIPLKDNPACGIKVAQADISRQRRLTTKESIRFHLALENSKWFVKPIVLIALETGMRRGEIFSLKAQDLSHCGSFLHIRTSKNGFGRTIPLSPKAKVLFSSISDFNKLFSVNLSTFREGWLDLIARADVRDYRFHDLRHEAISRFFEIGLSVPEVALISGHKDVRMLFRYTHIRPESVAQKLTQAHFDRSNSTS